MTASGKTPWTETSTSTSSTVVPGATAGNTNGYFLHSDPITDYTLMVANAAFRQSSSTTSVILSSNYPYIDYTTYYNSASHVMRDYSSKSNTGESSGSFTVQGTKLIPSQNPGGTGLVTFSFTKTKWVIFKIENILYGKDSVNTGGNWTKCKITVKDSSGAALRPPCSPSSSGSPEYILYVKESITGTQNGEYYWLIHQAVLLIFHLPATGY